MSRLGLTLAATVTMLVLTALPALAAETPAHETAKGSGQGILLTFVFGIAFGAAVVFHAYRGVRFGSATPHQEEAHDVREGFGDHAPPTGSA